MIYVISAILFIFGVCVSVMNWACFIMGTVMKKKTGSWIPLIGGGLTVISMILFPYELINRLCWIGLLADFGCIPGFAYTLYWFVFRKR